MSWTKKNVHPGKIVSTSQEVDVKVLEVDEEKRRISLGLKQAQSNPWEAFAEKHPVGSVVEGEVKNATEFGLFVGLEGDVDGMVHMSDIAWGVSGEEALQLHRKGETVKAQVLDVDVEKERISLGMKQLEGGGAGKATGAPRGAGGGVNKGDIVTVTVRAIQDAGLDVQVGDDGAIGFIKRGDLGRDRDEQRAERFQVGQKFDAMVSGFDRSKKPNFSVKALQIAEEKQAVAQYGSSDSGASLGDILGQALKDAQSKAAKPKAEAAEKPAKAEKAAKADKAEEAEKPAKAPKAKKAEKVETAEAADAAGGETEVAKKPSKKKK
jgi:small subunit ribosomal protein S1